MTRLDSSLDGETRQYAAFITTLCLVLASFLLVDMIIVLGTSEFGQTVRLFVIRYSYIAWLVPGAVSYYVVRRMGAKSGLYALFAGLLGYISVIHSRGIWIWSTTYDNYWDHDVRWKLVLVAGLLVGCAAGLLGLFLAESKMELDLETLPKYALRSCWILVCFVVVYTVMSGISIAESSFPDTRPVFVGLMSAVLFASTIVLIRKTEV